MLQFVREHHDRPVLPHAHGKQHPEVPGSRTARDETPLHPMRQHELSRHVDERVRVFNASTSDAKVGEAPAFVDRRPDHRFRRPEPLKSAIV